MKRLRALKKSNAVIILLSSLLFVSLTVLLCFGLGDVKGENGQNGKDAKIRIADNGEVILNEEQTGIFANKADCVVNVVIEGEEYGKVIGGGKFAKGQTVALQAIPNVDACFKGWKNNNGEIISYEQNYTFVAQTGEVELTAMFEKSSIEIYFRMGQQNKYYFASNTFLHINGVEQTLDEVRDNYGNKFYVLDNVTAFNYGDTITFDFVDFVAPSCEYQCYFYELDRSGLNEASTTLKKTNITNEMSYTLSITENRKYYFMFEMELNILIERIPTVEVSSNNEEYGTVSKKACTGKGDLVTLTAEDKTSGTEDYIYKFKGWYLNDQLVSKDYIYTFVANEYYYNFEARFVKKYALRFNIEIQNKSTIDDNIDPTSYYVSFKKITVYSIDSLGNINTISFNGNYGGQNPDLSTKICGYFEIGEKIFLSNEIESSHDTYYEIDGEEKTYKEKFVYTKWKYVENETSQPFATGDSALFMISEEMDITKIKINIMLFVIHYGDRIGD